VTLLHAVAGEVREFIASSLNVSRALSGLRVKEADTFVAAGAVSRSDAFPVNNKGVEK
jgi:hypothetical protein